MKALSIRQPWAWAILHAGKNIENRSWGTWHRGVVLIHAAKGTGYVDEYGDAACGIYGLSGKRVPELSVIPRGGIVGAMWIDRIVSPAAPAANDWHLPDQFGWHIARAVELPFRPLKGQLGLFDVECTAEELETIALWNEAAKDAREHE